MNEKSSIEQQIFDTIRNVPNFPKPGINFKDITPVLADARLCSLILNQMVGQLSPLKFDAVAGIESRGFIFGMLLAQALSLPFIPIRKKGKLPLETFHEEYQLEYGSAILEVHKNALPKGARVLLHDDLLATGGSAEATCKLLSQLGARVEACMFIVQLSFLDGKSKLSPFCSEIFSLINYTS